MFRKPNYTQTPNEFYDDIAKTLKEGELRVLLVIMRQTFGWGNKKWDRISLSQLEDKTGMCRDAVINSTKSLVEKKIILKHKEGSIGQEKSWYSLFVEEPHMEKEYPNEFMEESNISYQSSKTTPPSRFRRPTKETLTKETKSPVVPKGDILPRKSKREEKIERAPGVFISPTQEKDLLRRLKGDEEMVVACFDRLSAWKIGKEIVGGRNDYKSIVNWVIDAVEKEITASKPLERAQILFDKVRQYVDIQNPSGVIYGHDYVEFLGVQDGHCKIKDPSFYERVTGRLRKMGITL